jgi:hypothetical protein
MNKRELIRSNLIKILINTYATYNTRFIKIKVHKYV